MRGGHKTRGRGGDVKQVEREEGRWNKNMSMDQGKVEEGECHKRSSFTL